LSKSFLNPRYLHCLVLGICSEQITASPIRCKGEKRRRSQLFVCELLKEMQRFLARCSHIREKRLHPVVMMSIDVALIVLVCQCQPFLLSMLNGSSVIDQLTGNIYRVQNGQINVNVQG
jgi:hypothetical protein